MSSRRKINFWTGILALLLLPWLAKAQTSLTADSLYNRGVSLYSSGFHEKAEPLLVRAYALYRPQRDSTRWLYSGYYLGSVLIEMARYERAITHFRNLRGRGDSLITDYALAYIHNGIGQAFSEMGRQDSALRHYETAIPHAEASGSKVMLGTVLDGIGQFHRETGNYRRSLEYRFRALELHREEKDSLRISSALNNIGMVYKSLGLYDLSLEYLNRSLDIRRKLGNVSKLATIYNNVGGIQKMLSHYGQALIAYQKALEFGKQSGQQTAIARTLNNIGVLYADIGDAETALEYYRQSLELGEETFAPSDLSSTYRNIGNRLWDLGQKERAVALYERSLELRRQSGDPHSIAELYWELARARMETGSLDAASVYIEEGAFVADSTGHPQLLSDAAFWKGRLGYRREQYRQAIDHFRRAYDHSLELPPSQRISPLIWISNSYDRLGSDSTLFYGRQAYELIERNRERIGAASQLKREYLEQYAGFYLSLAARTIEYGGSLSDAYLLVEASKARTLSDELREASLRMDEQLPQEARMERKERLDALHRLYVERESAVGDSTRESLNRRIREAELSLTSYQSELARKYGSYRQLETPEPIGLERAQALCPPNTAILEYALASDRILIFLVSRDNAIVREVKLEEGTKSAGEVLTGYVQKYREAIHARASLEELDRLSTVLNRTLLEPVSDRLEDYRQLIIVPDGPLAYFPFEALRRDHSFLIESYSVKYVPSMTSLRLLDSPREEGRQELLAVAGGQFEGDGLPGFTGASALSTLPSTLVEVDSIASHFSRTTILKGEQVSERAVKTSLENSSYRFIHLATHGLIDEEHPAMSGLALGHSGELEAADMDDGLLRSSEIYRLKLNTQMVVLSACNTGLGAVVSGEGILGLQRSFFHAGASTVVVSLWNVYDRSASYMMQRFYRNLLLRSGEEASWWVRFSRWAGLNEAIPFGMAAEAMRQAKLDMIRHPIYGHPEHWAPFITVGR